MPTANDITRETLIHGDLMKNRRLVVAYLHENGGVLKSDNATGTLYYGVGATAWSCKMSAMPGLLKAMEDDGWILRDVQGKRTKEVVLCMDNPQVQRLVEYFDSMATEDEPVADAEFTPELPKIEVGPPDWAEHQEQQEATRAHAFDVADELLMRVVEILNTPTNEDLQQRLAQQLEESERLRRKLREADSEKDSLMATIRAKEARIRTLEQENQQLESNVRAALRQDRTVMGPGFRALERLMQQRPHTR